MKILCTLLILLFILQVSCEDSSSIIDADNKHKNIYGKLYRDTLVAINDTFIVGNKATTGYSKKYFLGSHNDFESRFLVKFNTLPADSITVDSLYLLLESVSHYGEPLADFDMQIKLINTKWDLHVNKDDDWSFQNDVSNDPATTVNYTLTTDDSLIHKIALPDTLVSIWRDTTGGEHNFGLAFDFQNAGYVKEFASENSTLKPKLVYVYQNAANDSTIRDTVLANMGASIVDYLDELSSDSLMYITSGFTHYGFVVFDFSSIKGLDSSIISNVNFIFNKDPLASDINKSQTNAFYLRIVTSPFDELPQFNLDSAFVLSSYHNVSLFEYDNTYLEVEDIRQGTTGQFFIQSIINEIIDYGSFMIQYVGEGNAISVYAVKGTESLKEADRPKMIIEYYKIPRSRL